MTNAAVRMTSGAFCGRRAAHRPESEAVDLGVDACIDMATLKRYRQRFDEKHPGHPCVGFDANHFLEHWALAVSANGKPRPTRAALLLFGTGAALRTIMPRPLVDCRWADYPWDAPAPERRWLDRLVCEENLWDVLGAMLADRYAQNAGKPFCDRDWGPWSGSDRPEDFISFREAAINLLMHQDFEETTRAGTIAFHPDRVVFENPGLSRAPTRQNLLEPGAKDVRNPHDRLRVPPRRSERAGRHRHRRDLQRLAEARQGAPRDRQRRVHPTASACRCWPKDLMSERQLSVPGFAGRAACGRRGERPGNPMWAASGLPT